MAQEIKITLHLDAEHARDLSDALGRGLDGVNPDRHQVLALIQEELFAAITHKGNTWHGYVKLSPTPEGASERSDLVMIPMIELDQLVEIHENERRGETPA